MERISCVISYEVVICLVASILVYSNAFNGPFLHDDIKAVVQNRDVQGEDWYKLWLNDFWGTNITSPTSHKSYRPLTIISFRITYLLWGLRSCIFRVENILLNSFVTVLLVTVCRRSVFLTPSTRRYGPLVTGLLFTLHPVHVEAVVGVVGRAELLSALFFFLSLIIFTTNPNKDDHHRHFKSEKQQNQNNYDDKATTIVDDTRNYTDEKNLRKRRNISNLGESSERKDKDETNCSDEMEREQSSDFKHLFVIICQHFLTASLCCCSMLCKETGITSFALLIALVLVNFLEKEYFSNKKQITSRKYLGSILFFCVTGWIIFYIRLLVMDFQLPTFHEMDNPAAASNRLSTKLMTFSALPWMNIWLLFVPYFLCYDWSYETIPLIKSVMDWRNFISLVFFILFVAFLFIQLCLIHEKSTDFRAMFLGTLLLVVPYFPSSNIFFPVGFVIAERTLFLPSAGFSVLISLFYCKVKEHSSKKRTLWCDAVLVLYLSFYATRTLIRNNDWSTKYNFHKSGVVWNPQNAKCQYNFANTLSALHRNKEAIEHYEESIKLYPFKSGSMNNLAYLLQTTYPKDSHMKSRVEKLYKSAIQLSPAVSESYFGLANFYIKYGHYTEAGKILIHGLKLIATLQRKVVLEILRKLNNKQQYDISVKCYRVLLCRECNKNHNSLTPNISMCDEKSLDYLVGYRELMLKLDENEIVNSIENRMKQLKHESSSEILLQTAQEFLKKGDAKMAAQFMLKILRKDSFYETTAWRMAQKLFRMGAHSESEQLYSQLTQISPANLHLLTQYAAVLYESGKEEKAMEMLGEKVKVDATCEMLKLRKQLSIMYTKQNLFLEAITTFENCMETLTDEKHKIYVLVNLAKIKREHYLLLRDSKQHDDAKLKIREIVQWLRNVMKGLNTIPENVMLMKEDLESEEQNFLHEMINP